ncbi:transposon polyprotein (fragment), putative [Candida dubliniensis CD36]|uniref:Transposon polyprotein, putative n=1 Tax=Candida dubliniensis (strain CD36 / ATCC MYA-646 / CBS 7987 / NCPF 3949 / NRRL Y-17841) TaxID=573826 RepID=B9W7S9_CANDC
MNGMVESHNNVVKKQMLYVMLNFPNRYKELLIFFCEIVAYAVFIKNHTPSERVETHKGWTPHELFYGRRYRPNYHQLGVDVFVILSNKQEAEALGVQFIKGFHRGVPGIFLGYGNDSNVYIIQLVDGNYTRRLFVNVRFLGSMNNINTFLDTFGEKMRKNMDESGNFPFFEDSSRNELLNGRYVPYEDHLPTQGTSSQDVSSDRPTTIEPTATNINMDELIAEVPDEFLQNNIAGDFLTQQGFTLPQLQVTGKLLEHQSGQSLAPYNWMSKDNMEYSKMGSDHKYLGQNDTENIEPNKNKQVHISEPSFQSSMANKPNESDLGVLPTADGIRHGVPNARGETTQDGTVSSNIDMHQPYSTIPTHRPPPPVGKNVQFSGVNNDSTTLLPSEWGLPPQQHLSNGGAYESSPVSNVTTSVRL